MHDLWTEKYRPNTLDGYVFTDQHQRSQIEKWISDQQIPHLMFSGAAGTGKTTLAKILINALGIHPYDLLQINASTVNSVNDVRNDIINFVSTIPFGKLKVVLLDEADHLSPQAQAALRGVMEEYSQTARFILTLNLVNKILPALKSRCQGFHIDKLDVTEFTQRVAEILISEGVVFQENTLDILDTYVKSTFPDLRKCINMCQMNTVDGQLTLKTTQEDGTADYRIAAVELIKSGNIRQARSLIAKQVSADQVDELISWAYQNLDLWSNTPEGQDQAILIIRKAAVNASLVADHEINVAAMLVELSQIN
jgi:DNA polymerase III delta prime subunit